MDGAGRSGMFRSLRFRMALSHGAILALILIVLGGIGYPVLARNLMDSATSVVRNAAQQEADQIVEAGKVTAPPEDDVPSASATRIGVFLSDGSIVGEREQVPSWLRPQSHTPVTITALGESVRVVTLPVWSQGAMVATVVAGRSLAPEEHLLDRVRLFLGLGFVIGVVAGMGAGWILAGRAARPVRRAYEAQASFAADASHEFRTPLAFVRSGVEVLGAPPADRPS